MRIASQAGSSIPASTDFGSPSNIPAISGSYVQVENRGYSTVGLHVVPPSGGRVLFYGSFDGEHYTNFTFRQIGSDGYSQEAYVEEDYVGSIIGAKALRFVNVSGGSSDGTVAGTLSTPVCTLEGIEHGAPPHKFGNELFHVGFHMSDGAFSNSGLYQPTARRKFVITYISMGVASADGTNITFHEGSGTSTSPNKWIFTTYVKSPSTNTQLINAGFTTPYVASSLETPFCISSDGSATIRGVAHGYSAEN